MSCAVPPAPSGTGIEPIAAALPVRPAKRPPFSTSPPPTKAPT